MSLGPGIKGNRMRKIIFSPNQKKKKLRKKRRKHESDGVKNKERKSMKCNLRLKRNTVQKKSSVKEGKGKKYI